MKPFKFILAAFAASSLLVSCSVLGNLTSSTSSSSTGSTTGSALASIYNVIKNSGTIDLSNLTNLISLGQILTGANSLVDASQSYTESFASGLISGSNNLITSSNVSSVISGLKNLAGTDTSALSKLTTSALTGSLVSSSSTSSSEVNSSVEAIKSIIQAIK